MRLSPPHADRELRWLASRCALPGMRVERQMRLAPRASLRVAVLTHLPHAFDIDLQDRAVDHEVQGVTACDDRQLGRECLCAAAQRRVVRHR